MSSVAEALRAARGRFAGIDTAALDAELLLAHVLGRSRTWLRAWPEHRLDPGQQDRYEALVMRRAAGEPVAYLLGRREFWSLELEVGPAVLIPRPETERLVEA
ncbi:MAG: protein-(glutamine-N5) methyltransferase, release factor-specific, partial [Halofilum sp. (in: g-proteobacteria)]|nr:protein-(glutamine-N5) methyltransferase, release factor-specific [Halofilum sp. (in: g-proteobacteria)]